MKNSCKFSGSNSPLFWRGAGGEVEPQGCAEQYLQLTTIHFLIKVFTAYVAPPQGSKNLKCTQIIIFK